MELIEVEILYRNGNKEKVKCYNASGQDGMFKIVNQINNNIVIRYIPLDRIAEVTQKILREGE